MASDATAVLTFRSLQSKAPTYLAGGFYWVADMDSDGVHHRRQPPRLLFRRRVTPSWAAELFLLWQPVSGSLPSYTCQHLRRSRRV